MNVVKEELGKLTAINGLIEFLIKQPFLFIKCPKGSERFNINF